MEAIYKHKKTGSQQIMSETTQEILGGDAIWEFVEDFNPSLRETTIEDTLKVELSLKQPKEQVVDNPKEETQRIRQVEEKVHQEKRPLEKKRVTTLDDLNNEV